MKNFFQALFGRPQNNLTRPQATTLLNQSLLDDLLKAQSASQNMAPSMNPMGGISGARKDQQANMTMPSFAMSALNPTNAMATAARGGAPTGGGISGDKGAQVRGGLLSSLSQPQPQTQQGLLGLMNNPMFAIGTALLNPRQSIGQNLQQGFQNIMQQQMYQQQMQRQKALDDLAVRKVDIDEMTAKAAMKTAGRGTLSTKTFKNKDGREIILNFDNKLGLLDSSGNVISPASLAQQGFTEVNPSQIAVYTGDSKEAIDSKVRLEKEKGKIQNEIEFAKQSNNLGLKRISETVYEPARGLMDFAKNVRNINEFISQSKLDKEKGGKIFKFKTNMLATMGLTTDEVSADEVVEALRTKYAPALREAGSGATSDYEMEMYLNAFPSLAMTAQGREMLERATTTIANRESEYSTLVQNFITKQGKIPTMNDLQRFQEQARNKFKMDVDVQKKLGIYNEDEEQFIQNFGVDPV